MSLISEGADFRSPIAAGAGLGLVEPSLVASSIAEPSLASVGDYIALMKPRVMSLVVFTALVGLAVAPGSLHPLTAFTALLCIAVGAGAAGALNMWYDADIDAVMTRTARRPVPVGRVQPGEGLAFGVTLGRLHAAHRHRTARGARHHRIDVGVVPHVERAGGAGADRDAEQRGEGGERMQRAGRDR